MIHSESSIFNKNTKDIRSLGIENQANSERIGNFETLTSRSFHERCGSQLYIYILDCINTIQNNLPRDINAVDMYPNSEFVLLNDKLNPTNVKRSIKTKGDIKDNKKVPLKKGQKQVLNNDPSDQELGENSEVNIDEQKEKVKSKKNITQVQQSAKNLLGFITNRFVYEFYSTNDGKNIRDVDEFKMFAYNNISNDFISKISKVIIPAVDMYGHIVHNMNDHKFTTYLSSNISQYFTERESLSNYIIKYIVTYYKLLAKYISIILWNKHSSVNFQLIETSIRMLNLGSDEYFIDNNIDKTSGLEYGIISHAREYDLAINLINKKVKKNKTNTNEVVDETTNEVVEVDDTKKTDTTNDVEVVDDTTNDVEVEIIKPTKTRPIRNIRRITKN